MKKIKNLFVFVLQNILKKYQNFNILEFPVDNKILKNKNIIKFDNHKSSYIVNNFKKKYKYIDLLKIHITKSIIVENVTFEICKIFKKTKIFKFKAKDNTIINLISQNKNNCKIKLNENINIEPLSSNKYYNFKLKKNDELLIEASNNIIFAPPLINSATNQNSIKLNLVMFVDGLIKDLVSDDENFSNFLPNTYNFFKKGKIFDNHFSNGEWSLPSAANSFSGCYIDKHKLFHNTKYHQINQNLKLIGEYFSENNFQTFMINGSWRLVPTYGFGKGFDKTYYKREMATGETIDHFLSIDTNIKMANKFYWLTFFDIHGSGSHNSLGDDFLLEKSNSELKSVNFKKNDYLKDRYLSNCKLLDTKLISLYNYIETTYSNDEILVSIITDHGQSFFDDGSHILRDSRVKIPWLLRGKGIEDGKIKNFSENIDILPTYLEKNNIKFNNKNLDGKLPLDLGGHSKDFVINQSLYPNQTYKMRIDFKNTVYFFETKNKVNHKCELKNFDIKKTKILNNDKNQNLDQNSKAENIFKNSCKNIFDN